MPSTGLARTRARRKVTKRAARRKALEDLPPISNLANRSRAACEAGACRVGGRPRSPRDEALAQRQRQGRGVRAREVVVVEVDPHVADRRHAPSMGADEVGQVDRGETVHAVELVSGVGGGELLRERRRAVTVALLEHARDHPRWEPGVVAQAHDGDAVSGQLAHGLGVAGHEPFARRGAVGGGGHRDDEVDRSREDRRHRITVELRAAPAARVRIPERTTAAQEGDDPPSVVPRDGLYRGEPLLGVGVPDDDHRRGRRALGLELGAGLAQPSVGPGAQARAGQGGPLLAKGRDDRQPLVRCHRRDLDSLRHGARARVARHLGAGRELGAAPRLTVEPHDPGDRHRRDDERRPEHEARRAPR